MRCITAIPLLLACLGGVRAAPAQENPIKVDQFGIKVDELREFLGLDIYKYVLRNQAVGNKFDLVLRQYDAADDAKPREFFRKSFTVWRTYRPSDAEFTVCFLKKDNTIGSALLSNEEEVTLRIRSIHCRPGGLATTISLPLADMKQKTLDHRVDAETERPDNADGTALFVLRKNGDQPGSVTYPYAELAIVPRK